MIIALLEKSKSILDIGCGPNGSGWYPSVPDESGITALDLFFAPTIKDNKFSLYKLDAVELDKFNVPSEIIEVKDGREIKRKVDWKEKFDLVVADHIFEHVSDPERLAKGISAVTQKGGYVHIGIPDPLNFTERFYHLIHPEGGGHISKITKEEMIRMMTHNGFVLQAYKDWADDWQWLKKLYDWKGRGIKYFSQGDLDFIADTFIKELTPEKGYFYGGEYVFKKDISENEPMFSEGRKKRAKQNDQTEIAKKNNPLYDIANKLETSLKKYKYLYYFSKFRDYSKQHGIKEAFKKSYHKLTSRYKYR